jgi:hypothetical protein
MKKPNDPIGNRTRYLPACNTVPQPTMQPNYPNSNGNYDDNDDDDHHNNHNNNNFK